MVICHDKFGRCGTWHFKIVDAYHFSVFSESAVVHYEGRAYYYLK